MSRTKIHSPVRNGRLNIAGLNIRKYRKEKSPELSQNALAALIQLEGLPMTKNTVQRMETGQGTINDIQLKIFAKVLNVSIEELLDESIYNNEAENLEVASGSPDYN